MKIRVNLKSAGKRRQSVEPVVYQIKGCPRNVRELILAVTESGVEAYNRRMDSRDILDYLTKEQMEGQAQEGKVSFGNHYGGKKAVLPEAQEHALQCFEDGIYRIFMDGIGHGNLRDRRKRVYLCQAGHAGRKDVVIWRDLIIRQGGKLH